MMNAINVQYEQYNPILVQGDKLDFLHRKVTRGYWLDPYD
jgi:hypothetical protein